MNIVKTHDKNIYSYIIILFQDHNFLSYFNLAEYIPDIRTPSEDCQTLQRLVEAWIPDVRTPSEICYALRGIVVIDYRTFELLKRVFNPFSN